RESGEGVVYAYRRPVKKFEFLDREKLELVSRGHDPWTVGNRREARRESEGRSFPFKRTNPKGIAGSHTGAAIWWEDGEFEVLGSAFTEGRYKHPPEDFFAETVDAQGGATSVFVMRTGGQFRSWNYLEGKEGEFSDVQGLVDFEAGREHVILRWADGSVKVRGINGDAGHSRTFPKSEIPKALTVRAGQHMSAVQKQDETWLAWGPSQQVVDAVENAGAATDLDVFAQSDEGYVIWIEPEAP
ncbi:MAG: hypothetical protein AAGA58_20165, partial [Verrucomicrobiota bacterium]